MMKPMKAGFEETQEQTHRIRITLSSKSVKNLEKGIDLFWFHSIPLFYIHFGQIKYIFANIFNLLACAYTQFVRILFGVQRTNG